MFISETHLPTLLEPWHYTSSQQLVWELNELFEPAWHCVGTTADVAGDGDYFTCELLGRPLLVRRAGGKVRAYLNVCAHRHCKLTSAACGRAAELRCQYHGWEYGDDGATRKIPDAQSFKPLEKGGLGLATFRTETVGPLVFVTLSPAAPTLAEYLGAHFERIASGFGSEWSQQYQSEREIECNWKVLVENSLESYHIDTVHAQTFGRYPAAENCEHELHTEWTSFRSPAPWNRREALLHALASVPRDPYYRHTHVHPNFAYSSAGVYATIECVYPVAPTRCRVVTRSFLHDGAATPWRRRLLRALVVRPARKFLARVNAEDAHIVAEVQAGLNSRQHPGVGLISKREERIFHFQRFIRRAADRQRPRPAQPGAISFPALPAADDCFSQFY